MQRLNNAKLGTKLTLLSGVALLIIVLLGSGGIFATRQMNRYAQSVIEQKLRPVQAVGEMRATAGAISLEYMKLKFRYDAYQTEGAYGTVSGYHKIFAEKLAQLQTAGFTGEEAKALADITQTWQDYTAHSENLWQTYKGAGSLAIRDGILASVLSTPFYQVETDLAMVDALLRRLTVATDKSAGEVEAALQQGEQLSLRVALSAITVSAVMLLLLSVAIRRSLVTPVNRLMNLSRQIGEGNLAESIEGTRRTDEIGRLHNSMAEMSAGMRHLLQEVHRSNTELTGAAESMSSTADQASRAAEQLAEAIEQVARGAADQSEGVQRAVIIIEEVRATLQQVTESVLDQESHIRRTSEVVAQVSSAVEEMAQRVQGLDEGAQTARQSAEAGNAVVGRAVTSMESLQAQVTAAAEMVEKLVSESQGINHAVTLIHEIAGQTNLLALNAAIEAARAGESGRGFAVVADEVRKLAERAAGSAREITDRIRRVEEQTAAVAAAMAASRSEALESGSLAGEAGRAFTTITGTVRETVAHVASLRSISERVAQSTADAVSAVAVAAEIARQNGSATTSIAQRAAEVEQVVREIAAVAEETAATSEEVSASVEELTAATTHVAGTSRTLAAVAEELDQQVSRFKLESN